MIKQLLPSAGDGVWIQTEEFRQNAIAAMSKFDGFQTSEQATLLLIEQAVEKQNGGFEFIGGDLENGSIGQERNRLRNSPGAKLIPSLTTIGGGVEEASVQDRAAETPCPHEIVERILDLGMEDVSQLVGEGAKRGLIDEGFNGRHQGAIARKPDRVMRPQACIVKAGGFAKGIVTTAMGIAGEIVEEFKLTKDRDVGSGAESASELGQGRNLMTQQVPANGAWIEGDWSHNVIVPTAEIVQPEL